MKRKIYISGSLAYDRIMNYGGRFADHIDPKKIHVLSLSFAVEKLELNTGGIAGNIAYNLSLLGERPSVIGNLGTDGREYLDKLKKSGIDTRYVKISKKKVTAGAYTITDRADNQITGFFAGAMYEPSLMPKQTKNDLALIGAEYPQNMVRLAGLCAKQKCFYIFDPAQQIPALTKNQLLAGQRGATVIIGNDYEIAIMVKKSGYQARKDQAVITTLGEKGSKIYLAGKQIKIPPAKVRKVADPTGAGDAYRAGLIKGLVLGYSYEQAGRLASRVAAKAVEVYGTQNHKLNWNSIKKTS
ncbi:MAG: hypothetical protein A2826_02415 [Candidatus Doudnabacteria bacterium RIFCSPHIGHO2_01_FULL_43_23]|uniref:Carbohydrate kinase PfkB domain-containing protein n=1 Tax=Candidatus Doudnabacteria bacterium RIFCSPHIGHO2_01_FULL_43_23 TaxID=1817822 RepID=A0A1F5NSF5_9BACT|nr:MAG: hypothetical protein A2826_02415 [Candidatus Doudnabacteria bacterium RIFCSPHIGHO2_01_FULL_43_23]